MSRSELIRNRDEYLGKRVQIVQASGTKLGNIKLADPRPDLIGQTGVISEVLRLTVTIKLDSGELVSGLDCWWRFCD